MKQAILVGALLSSWAWQSVALAGGCEEIWRARQGIHNKLQLLECSEYFFHAQNLDVPVGSYNKVIDLNLRVIALDPRDVETYAGTTWLLRSKYDSWRQNHKSMPDGEGRLEQSYQLLLWGRQFNVTSAQYLVMAGETLLNSYQWAPQYSGFVIETLEAADRFAKPTERVLQIQARVNLGRMYHKLHDREHALQWFHKTQEIDPHNSVAREYLKYYAEHPNPLVTEKNSF